MSREILPQDYGSPEAYIAAVRSGEHNNGKGRVEAPTSSQPTQSDNGRGRFSQTRQSYLENAEQKKEQQRALDAIRPQLNFPQYETVEQTRAALKGFEEKNRGLVNDPLSEVLYEGDVKKFNDQINLLSKFESGELSADFFGRGLDENSLAGQMQKDKAATEQRRAEQLYEAEVSQRISDGLSTEGAMNEKFGRTAPTEQQEQPEEEQSAVDRFMSLISGIGKGNAAAATGGQRLLYELGQGARSQMNEEAYAQAKADYDRALQAYEEELAAWGEQGAQSAYYVLQDAKRKLDAFGTVVEDEVQQKATQAASTLSQELNRQSGEDIAKAKEGLGTVGRIAVDTGAALGDILIDAASGMGALNMAGRVFGKSAIEAEAAGANTAQQLAYGTATAAFAIGLNKVIDGLAGVYGKGFGDDAAEAFIAKIASTDKGRNVARAILNIGGEGAEEFTEGAIEPLLKLIYDGGDAIKAVYSSPEAWSEALLDNLYSAAIGSVIGAGGQAVDVASGGYSAKNAATPLQPSDYTAPKTGLKPTSPQSAQESTGGAQIPPSTQTASTNAPDVLNSNIQPQSPIDIVMEVATGQKNTAPTQGTDSTAVNTDPMQHTPVEQAVISEYQNAVDDNLVNYIETVRDNPNAKIGRYSFKPVSEKAAAKIKELTGIDTAGNKTVIEPRMVGHILKDHGPNGETDQSMKDVNDIARIQYVIDNYDNIEHGGTSTAYVTNKPNGKHGNAQTVVFTKAVNGTYYVVEAVPDTAKKTVFVVSAYMQKKAAGTPSVDAEASRVTSENAAVQPAVYEAEASNLYIAQPGSNVNPKSNLGQGGDNGRTSQSASTVFEAGITPETRRAELEPFIQNGRFDYVPDSNARQTVRATRAIMKAGWKKSADDFKADVAAGKSGKDLVARGAVLLNNLSNSDASSQEYMDMVDSYIELMHRAGETLQAGKIVQQLTPEGRLYLIGKSIDRLNRNLTDSQRRKAAKKQGVEADEMRITVDPTLVDMYRAAQTDAERDAVIDEMQQNIAEQVPSTFSEKLTAFRYTAMLGNFKTQIRNLTGNAASVTTKLVKDRLAAAVEAIAKASGAEIEQTRSVAVSPALWKAAWNDFPANRDAALGEEKYTSASQQMEKGIQDKRTVFKSKALEGWRKGTQWAMQAGDSIFGRIAYADALGGWLQAHNVNFETATDEQLTRARSFAAKEAQEAVFRDKNAISDAVSSLGSNWKNSNSTFKKTVATIGEGIQPFRKTPANVLVRAEEYSPLGFINTVSAAVKAGKGEAEINDVINSAAKAMTGSVLAAAGYFLAAAGRLRGVEDDEELDKAQKANGAMDWSLVTDDGKYIALSQFAPATVPLFMGVRLAELTRGQDIEPKDIIEIIKGTTAPMFEMSMLSGLDSAFSDLSNYGSDATAFGQFIENALLSYAQQFIPALLRQAEQASEEYRQTTYTDSNNPWLDTNDQYRLGKISAGIPGLDYQQTDYIDMWGRKTEQGNAADRLFDAFINPTYTANSKAEPMDDELERLHKATKDLEDVPSVYPSFIARNTKLDKSGKVMTQKQYENYKISTGTKARELASDFIDSKEYKKLSDEQRAKVLSDLYSLASSQALKSAKRSQGITGDGLKTDWDTEAKLSDPAKFLAETAIAKANAEKKGETFSTRGADALAYFATKGFADDDMDILAEDMLGDRQAAVYDTMRAAGTSAKDTVSWYMSLDVNNSGVISQDEIYPALKNRDNLTDKQKAVIWENTQTGKTDWAAYLAKNAR